MVTLREISKKTGFAVSVVSRTLNRNPDKNAHVSPKTQRIIQKAAKELGYRPNRAAEFLRRGSAPTIGVFLPRIADRIVAELVFGIADEAGLQGFPLSFSFDMTAVAYKKYVAGAKDIAHCAIVTYPYTSDGGRWPDDPQQIAGIMQDFKKAGGKVVLIAALTPVEGVPNVACDDYAGGRLAAERLLERRCKQFILLNPYCGRAEGFADAVRAAGDDVQVFPKDPASIAELAGMIRASKPQDLPIGVFATGDSPAVRLLSALSDPPSRWRVGEDVLLIGYDNYWLGEDLAPALTTIQQPFEQVGVIAVRKAINMIYGGHETSQKLTPILIPRDSA